MGFVVKILGSSCLLLSALATAQPLPKPSSAKSGEAFVESFFAAFDRRDLAALEDAFLPEARIIHDNGVETDIPTMLRIIRDTRAWHPRERKVSECQTWPRGELLVVGCLNEVRFFVPDRDPEEFRYNETWVLERSAGGLRALRSHYSLITREEHSEEID